MKKKFQALVFDLDGTAIPNRPDGMPSQAVIDAIQEAKKVCHVSVATGRPQPLCAKILDALQIEDLCIVNGGTYLYSRKRNETLWKQELEESLLNQVIAKLADFGEYMITDEKMLGRKPDVSKLQENEIPYPLVPIKEYKASGMTAGPFIEGVPKEAAVKIVSLIKEIDGVTAHPIVSWKKGLFSISITHELATKKHALQALLSHLNVKIEDVMVVGDGGNDLPLFELAGWRVAMGNASEELKAAADWVAPSVDEDGLAVAIEKFILKNN